MLLIYIGIKKMIEEKENQMNNQIVFKHAGYDYILSNLKSEKKEYNNIVHTAFLQYYSTNVKIKISRWDNNRYDNEKKINHHYKCTSIHILRILKGEINEDLYGFIKFLEYCFDFNIIDICDNELVKKNE